MRRKERHEKAPKRRIRDWKGLLQDEPRTTRALVFVLLLVVSTSMTFMQFGFIGIGTNGDYLGYALGLLAPISAIALLLGKGWGTLGGLLSGAVLLAHARFQPLDLYESYFVSPLNSLALYSVAGFFLGLMYAIALRNGRRGALRKVWLVIVSMLGAFLVLVCFFVNMVVDMVSAALPTIVETGGTLRHDSMMALEGIGGLDVQLFFNFLLMLVVSLLCDRVVRSYHDRRDCLSVRTIFRTRLLVAMLAAFLVMQAGSFVVITERSKNAAHESMSSELEFIGNQIETQRSYAKSIVSSADDELPDAMSQALVDGMSIGPLVGGYSLTDGTVVVLEDNAVRYSNNTAYAPDATTTDLFGAENADVLDSIAESGEMRSMIYQTRRSADAGLDDTSVEDLFVSAQLGYMCAARKGSLVVVMAMPSSLVFSNRSSTVRWTSFLALSLLVVTFVMASRLMRRVVVEPIDHTNDSLAKITGGDLGVLVSEVGSVEFASLSAGINATVDALKRLIGEAEARMERDLATAKAIQQSALPSTFPPFPEIDAFDIYASMNAAKEVGGDFYDFFLVDDHTLGFLIADVSGKGIPGALFMMAAKTEIENYLSTGMAPAEAIASANRRLCANNDAGMFVTVWAATLDYTTGVLTYVNAGHNFPLLRHGQGGSWEWLKKRCGLFLGTFETAKYRQETLVLEPGDELLLYTDGVNEAFDVHEEEFGNDRLEAFLANHAYMGPKMVVQRLRAEVGAWAEGAEQSDDITILALEFGATPDTTGQLTLPATLDHLEEGIAFVSRELERRLCPVGTQHKVEVALEEMLVNVCSYAYAEKGEPGEVTVSYIYCADQRSITVELRDQGVPFDPLEHADPTRPASIDDVGIGGLGILMVKRSMDDVSYVHDGDSNVLAFTKRW